MYATSVIYKKRKLCFIWLYKHVLYMAYLLVNSQLKLALNLSFNYLIVHPLSGLFCFTECVPRVACPPPRTHQKNNSSYTNITSGGSGQSKTHIKATFRQI